MNVDPARSDLSSRRGRLRVVLAVAFVFIMVSVIAAPKPGINEPHYLCKARAFAEPGWCERDFFLQSANAHSCFFLITGAATRFLPLPLVALGGRIVSLVLLAAGWERLTRAVGLTRFAQFIAGAVFATVSQLGSFSGEWLLGGFESKVASWGLALASIGIAIDGVRRNCPGIMVCAGAMCGVATALHPVVGGWVALCTASAIALRLVTVRSAGSRWKSLCGLATFCVGELVCALPGLIPAIRLVTDDTLPVKDRELASYIQVFWRLSHHLDPTELVWQQWAYAAVLCGVIGWCAVVLLRSKSGSESAPRPVMDRTGVNLLLLVFAMSVLLAAVGVAIGWHSVPAQEMTGWAWRASLLKFYPFRTFDALLPIVAAISVAAVVSTRTEAPKSGWSGGHTDDILAALLSAMIIATIVSQPTPPGYTPAQYADWKAACDWIRTSTPADTLVLTPRESFGFKWFAERAEYVCYKDCPQDAPGILEWNKRLWQIHDWSLASSSGDAIYSDAELAEIGQRTGCEFLLTRTLGPFESEPVARFGEWMVLSLPRD